MGAVPTHLKVLIDNIVISQPLNYVLVAGEVFTKSLYDQLKSTVNAEMIINLYGPTETTIFQHTIFVVKMKRVRAYQ